MLVDGVGNPDKPLRGVAVGRGENDSVGDVDMGAGVGEQFDRVRVVMSQRLDLGSRSGGLVRWQGLPNRPSRAFKMVCAPRRSRDPTAAVGDRGARRPDSLDGEQRVHYG